MKKNNSKNPSVKEVVYCVKGMHCPSCEILIEKEISSLTGVESVEASTANNKVIIEYEGKKPSVEKLNEMFKREKYLFFHQSEKEDMEKRGSNFFSVLGIALLIIIGFLGLNKLGIANAITVDSNSSLPLFFVFGLIAGLSSCAALVGGLILSMSKQWMEIYSGKNSFADKIQPHLMFNMGRLISYGFFGALLGLIGQKLGISLQFTSFLAVAVSILMFFLGLQMLGVKSLRKFQFSMPKTVTRYIADESNFKGRYMPFIMGASTFFLPCGFTITAQSLALISGSFIQGAAIMLSFALGTFAPLLAIGVSSVKFFSKTSGLSDKFLKVAGVLVLFFALFNFNSQMNVLGFPSINDLNLTGPSQNQSSKNSQNRDDLPQIVDGKQVIKMNASSSGYSPNYFKVKAGVPVRWEITDVGTSGCTNAVISKGLFSDAINLTPGQTSIKEFTPTKTGKYKFSCWMGMVSGIIEVIDDKNSSSANGLTNNVSADSVVPSGAQGCGCGGGNR